MQALKNRATLLRTHKPEPAVAPRQQDSPRAERNSTRNPPHGWTRSRVVAGRDTNKLARGFTNCWCESLWTKCSARGPIPNWRARAERSRLPGGSRRTDENHEKIQQFRGDARFTTWAFRFVVLEVSNALGRHFWRVSNTQLDIDELAQVPDRSGIDPAGHWQARELVEATRDAVETALTARQRRVFTAVINGVPLETLASELKTNRNTLYKTMFDARRKLRARLMAGGHLSAAG